MAKISYLNATNRILRRISEIEISDVTAAAGDALIITDFLNEAQIVLFNEVNWYSLYTTRTITTVASTQDYAVASDFGKTLDLVDTTNGWVLTEDVIRAFDEADPRKDTTGPSTHFSLTGSNYTLWPIPDAVYSITDRYWKFPTTLAANANTSDLPQEVEVLLIYWAWAEILDKKNSFEKADRIRTEYEKLLKKAKRSNKKIIDRMDVFQPQAIFGLPLIPPSLGSRYPRLRF